MRTSTQYLPSYLLSMPTGITCFSNPKMYLVCSVRLSWLRLMRQRYWLCYMMMLPDFTSHPQAASWLQLWLCWHLISCYNISICIFYCRILYPAWNVANINIKILAIYVDYVFFLMTCFQHEYTSNPYFICRYVWILTSTLLRSQMEITGWWCDSSLIRSVLNLNVLLSLAWNGVYYIGYSEQPILGTAALKTRWIIVLRLQAQSILS